MSAQDGDTGTFDPEQYVLQMTNAGECEFRCNLLYDEKLHIRTNISFVGIDNRHAHLKDSDAYKNSSHCVLVNNTPERGMLVIDPTYLPGKILPISEYLRLLVTAYDENAHDAMLTFHIPMEGKIAMFLTGPEFDAH